MRAWLPKLTAALVLLGTGAPAVETARADDGGGESAVLARVAGRTITVADFRAEMATRSDGDPERFATLEARQALLDELVRREMLMAKALEAGYDRDPEYVAAMQKILISRFTEDRLDRRLAGITVSEAEVRERFESERGVYSRPERVRGAMIFLEVRPGADEAVLEATAARAEDLRRQALELDDVTHLGRLALENSDDRATRYTGGVLPWMMQGREYKWGREVVDALFAIEEDGGVAPVVRTDRGFYVLRLVTREGSQELPFEMYAAGIRRRLLREKQDLAREAFYGQLASSTDIEVDPAPLQTIPGLKAATDEDDRRPPPLPDGGGGGGEQADEVEQP